MGKRRFPWHDDIDLLISRGVDHKAAQTAVILTWMERGDLRPLADVITDGQPVDRSVLHCLASMIFKRALVAKRRRGRGRPRLLGKAGRDQKLAQRYEELAKNLSSVEAFRKAGHEFGATEASARKALTRSRS
jgi:hypothetical protein